MTKCCVCFGASPDLPKTLIGEGRSNDSTPKGSLNHIGGSQYLHADTPLKALQKDPDLFRPKKKNDFPLRNPKGSRFGDELQLKFRDAMLLK